MNPRYVDPRVEELWSPSWTYGTWLRIETEVLRAQLRHKVLDDDALPLLGRLETTTIDQADLGMILDIEKRTQHDVVAFLEWVRSWAGPRARFLHYGLTSSDVVDTAQGMRFNSVRTHLQEGLLSLQSALTEWTTKDEKMLGRTHGQTAELVTMRTRAWAWISSISAASVDLLRATRHLRVAKLSGPVGTYAHNPPIIEVEVAQALGLYPHGPGATQIAMRQPLAAWASSVANLVDAIAKMAHDLRLLNLKDEVGWTPDPGAVASSSMAHKYNPIRAEQLGGMSVMARGYASMLQQQPIWLERDISNSAPERVAVPDLLHVLFNSLKLATDMLNSMYLDEWGNSHNILAAGVAPAVATATLRLIDEGQTVSEARAAAQKINVAEGLRLIENPTANYPHAR